MSLHLENFKNQPPIAIINDTDIEGISYFKKSLERLFFSKVVIRNSATNNEMVKLVIEVSCNFDIADALSNLDQGIWAQYRKNVDDSFNTSIFHNLVDRLKGLNNFDIDVVEFSILFNNCNIIINKIYEHSIPEQLDAILTKLSLHYTHLSKSTRETPFEIFIPIFEEEKMATNEEPLVASLPAANYKKRDYFKYWGLYFYSEEDALIYTLKDKAVISGDLHMLND